MNTPIPSLIIVSGATASGKSAFAVELAHAVNGEIVNADAMQVYRGLDIGTAKIPLAERNGIPHHLLDIADIHDPVDVFRYIDAATHAIADITARGKRPILCGGTGYYIKSLIEGLDDLPGDKTLRAELDARFDSDLGETELRALMAVEDPLDFERFGTNRRKLIRAREVFLLTGRPMVSFHSDTPRPKRYNALMLNIVRDRDELKQRIAERTVEMLRNGWSDETRRLIGERFFESPTARQAIGYALVAEHLNGIRSLDATAELIATRTWQYARRQLTWFRTQHKESEELVMRSEGLKKAEFDQLVDRIIRR